MHSASADRAPVDGSRQSSRSTPTSTRPSPTSPSAKPMPSQASRWWSNAVPKSAHVAAFVLLPARPVFASVGGLSHFFPVHFHDQQRQRGSSRSTGGICSATTGRGLGLYSDVLFDILSFVGVDRARFKQRLGRSGPSRLRSHVLRLLLPLGGVAGEQLPYPFTHLHRGRLSGFL